MTVTALSTHSLQKKEKHTMSPSLQGVVKDKTGAVNDQITILYYGPKAGSTGIGTLKSDRLSNSKVIGRYNLNGQSVNAVQKGVQILKYADGTVRKVVVK